MQHDTIGVLLLVLPKTYLCNSSSIFFFKQKTAYEMRISDWSSDVCSSDLFVDRGRGANQGAHLADQIGGIGRETGQRVPPGDGPAGHGAKRRAMWTATIPPL